MKNQRAPGPELMLGPVQTRVNAPQGEGGHIAGGLRLRGAQRNGAKRCRTEQACRAWKGDPCSAELRRVSRRRRRGHANGTFARRHRQETLGGRDGQPSTSCVEVDDAGIFRVGIAESRLTRRRRLSGNPRAAQPRGEPSGRPHSPISQLLCTGIRDSRSDPAVYIAPVPATTTPPPRCLPPQGVEGPRQRKNGGQTPDFPPGGRQC